MRKYKWVNTSVKSGGYFYLCRRLLTKVLDDKGKWRGHWTQAYEKNKPVQVIEWRTQKHERKNG